MVVLQPRKCRNIYGLGWSPFARHYLGNHSCFLFLRLLRCFSSAGLLPDKSEYLAFNQVGCPIRKSMDQGLFAPPHDLSQLITSFFASESLGILRTPLCTFFLPRSLWSQCLHIGITKTYVLKNTHKYLLIVRFVSFPFSISVNMSMNVLHLLRAM